MLATITRSDDKVDRLLQYLSSKVEQSHDYLAAIIGIMSSEIPPVDIVDQMETDMKNAMANTGSIFLTTHKDNHNLRIVK